MHHRSRSLTRPQIPRPQGSRPALERSGQSGCVGAGRVPGPAGPRGQRHAGPLRLTPLCWWPAPPRWPRSCWRPTGERPKDSRRARPRQRSSPASSSNRGAGNNHYFKYRCWVFAPGVEFTGKRGEEPLSGEEGRPPPLECPAARRPSAGPTWRDVVGSKIKFLREGGPNDGWLTSTANSGSGPASLVCRLASISLRPALRIPDGTTTSGADLLSFLCTKGRSLTVK